MKKGKFVVIEGTDGSGKATQLGLLEKNLKKRGFKVKVDDYPHYDQFWGGHVGKMLMGDFGEPAEISPYLSVLPYMIDEYFGGLKIKKWVEDGCFVLSNRYFTSNVHQVGKLKGAARKKYRRWLWDAGWKRMGIYKPQLVIVLLVPPEIGMELVKKKPKRSYTRGKKTDKVERDKKHQEASFKGYKRMCQKEKDWLAVSCVDRRGKVFPVEVVQEKIIRVLERRSFI